MKNTADPNTAKVSLPKRLIAWLKHSFCMEPKDARQIALNGLLFKNPVFVLMLGLCPTLATTTSLQNGIGMGLSTAIVLVFSALVISLLRSIIPHEIRTVSCAVISATFATVVDLLMQAYIPELSEALGLYVPLIAVNCILLGRTKAFATQNLPGKAVLDGLFTGLGFTGALAIVGAVREILGTGTVWGAPIPVLSQYPVTLILSPCGGFITLGFLIALVQFIRRTKPRKEREVESHESC